MGLSIASETEIKKLLPELWSDKHK
jgi:hypothetical protein